MINYIITSLTYLNISKTYVDISAAIITILLFIFFLYIIWYISKISSQKFLNSKYFNLKSKRWNAALKETNFFAICGYVCAGFIAHFVTEFFFPEQYIHLNHFANKIINIYFFICLLLIINKILTVFRIVHDAQNEVPIKGFIQFLKIFINFFGALIIFAYFIGKEPTYFISALGIIASVLMIVFKDTILGFTAGWQLSMNDMIHLGDWIEMPKHNADGNVVDISLTTVYVQNWDNTIVTIPAYDLLSGSFQNWRGMIKSGARRIKRSIFIDMQSIKFVDEKLMEKLKKFELLKQYIEDKGKEIKNYNTSHNTKDNFYNGRYFTNIGLFRIYCQEYIRTRTYINTDFTAMVRQKDLSSQGIPLEIYCFTRTTEWAKYEGYQADIFDHLLSVMGEFELFVFQTPSGRDFKKL